MQQMNNTVIITDSTSDLNGELRKHYGIDYCQMELSDGEHTYAASLDWEAWTPHEFYDSMRKGVQYQTTQVSTRCYQEVFSRYLQEGRDVVYIGCSSALSGSVAAAQLVAKELRSRFRGRQVFVIDSLLSGMGQGLMVIEAAKQAQEGKNAQEIASAIEEGKLFYNQIGTVETLEYLKRAGRVTASSAFFGNLFAVKPILISDVEGQNVAVRKVKGRKTSLEETAAQVAQFIRNPEEQTVWVSHADALKDAETVARMIRERLPETKVCIADVGPIVGISVGPGTIIAYFRGVHKSEFMKQLY